MCTILGLHTEARRLSVSLSLRRAAMDDPQARVVDLVMAGKNVRQCGALRAWRASRSGSLRVRALA